MSKFSVIGQRVHGLDAVELATGQAQFGPDVVRPGALCAKVLRSPLPHARIVAVRTDKAERVPGVKAVVTAKDTPDRLYGFWLKDLPVLAGDRVRYCGEPVVAVAAIDEDTALDALSVVEVDYEELPAVFDALEAVEPTAPLIHEGWETYEVKYDLVRDRNICSHTTFVKGDIEEGFRESDHVFEATFRTPTVHQAYLEPHAATVEIDSMGRVTIWTTTQRVFLTREQVHEALGIPWSRIRVIGTYLGGGFGGKETLLEPILVLLAQKSGKPVRWEFSREEEFQAGRPRHASIIRFKTGVKADGTVVARQAEVYYDTGAYADTGPGVAAVGGLFAIGPYRVKHAQVDTYCVYTNKVISGAFRAYGNPQGSFAAEVQMDMIARELCMDPLDIRLKNVLVDGDELVTGQILASVGVAETLKAATERAGWRDRKSEPNQGWGMATMIRPCGIFPASCVIRMNEDGTIHLLTGAMDLGTGAKTTLAMIAAEELGLSLDDVTVVTADTETTPYDYGAVASRTAFAVGGAVRNAAITLRQQVFEIASAKLGTNTSELVLADGRVSVKGAPDRSIPLHQIAWQRPMAGSRPLIAHGRFIQPDEVWDRSRARGYPLPAFPSFASATQIFKIAADPETGKVKVLRVVAAQDVGKAINPVAVEGQIEGGLVQGLGYALYEECLFRGGGIINPSLYDYRIPTSFDVPEIELEIIEKPDPVGPYGVKGVGEASLVPPAPAIANAVHDAVGVWPTELPITPERVFWLIREKENREAGAELC
jgi:carbon-monoxide dehydrogenase large subunit